MSIENGKFRDIGIKKGFVITHIDKKIIASKKTLIKFIKNKKGGILI